VVDVDGGVYRVNRRKILVPRPAKISVSYSGEKAHAEPDSLAHISAFSALSAVALETIGAQLSSDSHPLGHVIAKEGEASKTLYIAVRGKIEVSVVGPYGDKLRQALLAEGDYFGADALLAVCRVTQRRLLEEGPAACRITPETAAVAITSPRRRSIFCACLNANDALDLLLHPRRLIATLRM